MMTKQFNIMDTMPNNKRLADCTLSELIQMDINPGVVSVSSEQLKELTSADDPKLSDALVVLTGIEHRIKAHEEYLKEAESEFDALALELKDVTKRYRISMLRLSRARMDYELLGKVHSGYLDYIYGDPISPEDEIELEDELPF